MRVKFDVGRAYGAWTIERWERLVGDAVDVYPHGTNGMGRFLFTAGHAWSLFLQTKDWRSVDAGVRPTPDRFLAMAGDWTLTEDGVALNVQFASTPQRIATSILAAPTFARRQMSLRVNEPFERPGASGVDRLLMNKC